MRSMLYTLVLALAASAAWCQAASVAPRIGYLYPAGGQVGTVSTITAGGQHLRGARAVYVSGEGVRATVTTFYKPVNNLDADERRELERRMKARRDALLGNAPAEAPATPVALPPHPWFDHIDTMSMRELDHVKHALANYRKRQPNQQIAEMLHIELSIDATAAPGERELRVATGAGLSNPLRIQIGTRPEIRELEPNDPAAQWQPPIDPPAELPAVVNGQIMPGDVDRFAFHAKRGQHVVIDAQAQALMPYLADAVPGWFQATLALYDSNGSEIGFADDHAFHPDPTLAVDVPEDGDYVVEIQDAIFRGREDFVYRVALTEATLVARAPEATAPGVFDGPQRTESEPNDALDQSMQVTLPLVVDGCIQTPGDVDIYQFQGKAGEEIVAEVFARRLDSPLDSLVRLNGESGEVLAWNDDCEDKGSGLITHHADSYLRATLPSDGRYSIRLTDAQAHGGGDFNYRVRIAAPQPDFALRVTPSSINIPVGRAATVDVYVLRRDGFDGDVTLRCVNSPAGIVVDGAHVPAGLDHIRMTMSSDRVMGKPFQLEIQGSAEIDGQTITHAAVPAEDMTQAFMYHHLTPSQDLMATVVGKGGAPAVRIASVTPVRLATGSSSEVVVRVPKAPMLDDVRLELSNPPAGITMEGLQVAPEGLRFMLHATDTLEPGFADNLIVHAFTDVAPRAREGKAPGPKRRVSLGVLPAIPIEIIMSDPPRE